MNFSILRIYYGISANCLFEIITSTKNLKEFDQAYNFFLAANPKGKKAKERQAATLQAFEDCERWLNEWLHKNRK